VQDKKVKEGRYLIALAHEVTMASASPSLIDSSWASADGFRRSLKRSSSSFAASSLGLTFLSCTHIALDFEIRLAVGLDLR
jgi:hypothetical protein